MARVDGAIPVSVNYAEFFELFSGEERRRIYFLNIEIENLFQHAWQVCWAY